MRELDALVKELEGARQQIEALKEAETRYRSIFENAGDSIFIVEPGTFRLLEVNDNAARRLGYTKPEILQLCLKDIEAYDEVPEFIWRSRVSNTVVYETVYLHKDGTRIPVEVSNRLMPCGDQFIFQNSVRDISIRKSIEAERERLVQDLETFAGTVAHDLKNPLSASTGYVELLIKFGSKFSREKTEHYLGMVLEANRQMNNIIKALLLLSVAQTKKIKSELLDMRRVIHNVRGRLAHMIEEYDAVIEMPESWPAAYGYAPWVEEVWANYLSNALKYGGRPPLVNLGVEEQEEYVCFWVEDNGKGIAQEDFPKLFRPFTQLGGHRENGHGLGLSIVKRIIKRLGGEVNVRSSVGSGSTFSFTLPKSPDLIQPSSESITKT